MWERYTRQAKAAIFNAQVEAEKRGDKFVYPGDILIGILRLNSSLAEKVLREAGVNITEVWRRIGESRNVGKFGYREKANYQLTPPAKRCVDFAHNEARRLYSDRIGTEHLLLGLIRYKGSWSVDFLREMGADLERMRSIVENFTCSEVCDMSNDAKHPFSAKLTGRNLISIGDLSAEEIKWIFDVAERIKSRPLRDQVENPLLPGKTLAMIFEKPSLRTRVTFETGMTHLGGHAIYLQPNDIRLGERESVADAARNLSRWVNGIMARTFKHKTVTDLAEYASVPVINGLSDLEHPCQALADFLTIYEKKRDLKSVKLVYIGDGNNVCNSLLLLAAKVGTSMTVGCPEGYEPDSNILSEATEEAKKTGSVIEVISDPFDAVKDADVIYTDVWTSMGQEAESKIRMQVFQPYQVNQKLVDEAKDDVIVLHCLPAHRGEEITDEVMDGTCSAVLDQAENRLHAQKAVMALLM